MSDHSNLSDPPDPDRDTTVCRPSPVLNRMLYGDEPEQPTAPAVPAYPRPLSPAAHSEIARLGQTLDKVARLLERTALRLEDATYATDARFDALEGWIQAVAARDPLSLPAPTVLPRTPVARPPQRTPRPIRDYVDPP